MECIRDDNYKQVCVWQGTHVEWDEYEQVQNFLKVSFNMQHPIKIIGNIITLPSAGGPGGRSDFCFLIHNEEKALSNVKRLEFSIRWWEDVLMNLSKTDQKIYPLKFRQAYPPIFNF